MNKATDPSPFLSAVISFEAGDVKQLLASGTIDVNEADCRGWAAVHHAAANDDVNTLRVLLDAGADLTKETPDCQISRLVCLGGGNNLMHIAAMSGSEEVVSFLLNYLNSSSDGVDCSDMLLNETNFDGATPADLARIYNKTGICKLLQPVLGVSSSSYCSFLTCWQRADLSPCLFHPATSREENEVAYELRMTSRIRNANSISKPAPATLASFPVIGTPAVMAAAAAAAAEQETAFRSLLAKAQSEASEGPCTESEPWTQLERWLCDHDVNAELGASGDTPLHVACVLDAPQIVSLLLQRNANPNVRHRNAQTVPLLFCSEFGQDECVKALLDCSTINTTCTTRDSKVVMGQAVAVYTCGGRTSLHLAANSAHLSVIKLLLGRVDPSAVDSSGLSALDLVIERIALLSPSTPFRHDLLEVARVLCVALHTDLSVIPSVTTVKEIQATRQKELVSRVLAAEREAAHIARTTGLACIREHYTPLHAAVYESINPAFSVSDEELPLFTEPVRGVQVLPLLSPQFCAQLWSEVQHYANCARARPELHLPLHTRHDGNIADLQDCGFGPMLDQIMHLVRPLTSTLYPQLGELRCFHAFVTRNFVGREEVFRTHRDQAALTINVCLHKTVNVEGSTVAFFSAETDPEIPTKETYRHSHTVGTAVIHDGSQWHRVDPIVRGERGSLIIWARPVETKPDNHDREGTEADYM